MYLTNENIKKMSLPFRIVSSISKSLTPHNEQDTRIIVVFVFILQIKTLFNCVCHISSLDLQP